MLYYTIVLCIIIYSGPLVMLRLELGVLSRGNLGPVEVVSEYIRLNKIDQVRMLCRAG